MYVHVVLQYHYINRKFFHQWLLASTTPCAISKFNIKNYHKRISIHKIYLSHTIDIISRLMVVSRDAKEEAAFDELETHTGEYYTSTRVMKSKMP